MPPMPRVLPDQFWQGMRNPPQKRTTVWPRGYAHLTWYCCSAVKAKTQTFNQIRALLVSTPQALRDAVYKADAAKCVAACATLSHDMTLGALNSLQTALRALAKRWTALHDELRELDAELARITKKAAPRLLSRFGVGPQTASTLLITAGLPGGGVSVSRVPRVSSKRVA